MQAIVAKYSMFLIMFTDWPQTPLVHVLDLYCVLNLEYYYRKRTGEHASKDFPLFYTNPMRSTTKRARVPLYFYYSMYSACLQKENKKTKTVSRGTQVSLGMVSSPPYSWKKILFCIYFV